jgi:hypothetical protein
MTIGLGIALFGVWLFPAVALFKNTVKNSGVFFALIIAILITVYLTQFN